MLTGWTGNICIFLSASVSATTPGPAWPQFNDSLIRADHQARSWPAGTFPPSQLYCSHPGQARQHRRTSPPTNPSLTLPYLTFLLTTHFSVLTWTQIVIQQYGTLLLKPNMKYVFLIYQDKFLGGWAELSWGDSCSRSRNPGSAMGECRLCLYIEAGGRVVME